MKITAVTPLVLGTAWRELVFVKVETDEGITGYGEVRPLNKTQALLGYLNDSIERHVIGHDPFEIEKLVQQMMTGDFNRPGEIAMSATAILEIACWDIMGKALNLPVYRLLGGAVRDRIKLYANGWYKTERTPTAFADAALAAVAKGYQALKFDPFGGGFFEFTAADKRLSIAICEAVRTAVGPDVELLIEMHGRFTPAGAIEMARALAPLKPSWFEEPVPPENLAALKKVSEGVASFGIPIATGERIHTPCDYRQIFELQAADIVQTDITHFGGLMNTKKLAAWADAYYIRIAPHNVGGAVSTAAALHLAAVTPNFLIQENFNDFDEPYVLGSAPGLPKIAADGTVALPKGPGLGVEVDESVIAAHPPRKVFFNLYGQDWQLRKTAAPRAPAAAKS
ncbi:MAG: mandelate racemase/muconate lactonizing enzyme family protein [Opitutus sp.]